MYEKVEFTILYNTLSAKDLLFFSLSNPSCPFPFGVHTMMMNKRAIKLFLRIILQIYDNWTPESFFVSS